MTTIKDIAKAAGVSVTTVSRALNGYSDVNEKTRHKIQQWAKSLGYRPNAMARGLVMKKSKTLGLIVSEISRQGAKDSFTYEVLCGINDRAGELSYDLVLFSTNPRKQLSKSYTDLCMERGVDGAIIMGIRLDDPYLQEVIDADIPCVLIDIPLEGKNLGYITTDNIQGAKKATRYLLSKGHIHIGMINGHEQASVSIKRLYGFKEALEEAGIPYKPTCMISGDFTELGGQQAMYLLLHRHPEITAVFCASDLMALGAMQAIEKLGKKVPEDISVVGYDNIHVSAYTSPKLTTVNQDKYDIGYHAAQLLIDMLEERKVPHEVVLESALIERGSVIEYKG